MSAGGEQLPTAAASVPTGPPAVPASPFASPPAPLVPALPAFVPAMPPPAPPALPPWPPGPDMSLSEEQPTTTSNRMTIPTERRFEYSIRRAYYGAREV